MRMLGVLATVVMLLAYGPANAQEATDFLEMQGERVPLTLSLDRLGILAREGTTAKGFRDFAESRSYKIAEELPGGLYILDIGREAERTELAQLPRSLKRENDSLIAQAGFVATGPGINYPLIITDEIIVQFRPEVPAERINAVVAEQSASIARGSAYYPNQFIVSVDATSKGDALQLSARFQSMADLVEFAQPNFVTVVEPQEMIPNDRLFGDQWHHRNTGQTAGMVDADIDTSLAWDIEQGAAATTIAIIDFGFDMAHPDLQPNFWQNAAEINGTPGFDDDGHGKVDDFLGWDFVDNDNDPSGPDIPAGSRHGTAGAGVAAAKGNNTLGVSGSCPNCSLMLIRIGATSTPETVADAIGYATVSGAQIITNSWAYTSNPSLESALNSAATTGRGGRGSIVLLAMRNGPVNGAAVNDCGPTSLPALDKVIAIGRSTNLDLVDNLAPFGSCLDLLAPTAWLSTISSGKGTRWITTTDMMDTAGYNSNDILAPCPEPSPPPADARDYTKCYIGTSSSTPLTAGVAGLILTASPNLQRSEVQRLLQDTADKIEDSVGAYAPVNGYSAPASGLPTHGWGRVNAYEAVRVIAPAAQGGHAGVDLFMRDNRLDWGNTEQPSNTLFENPRGMIGHWESMDIKVDAPPYQAAPSAANFDAFVDETPSATVGDVNRIFVRVRNRGPNPAMTATVKLHWAQFGTALPPLPSDFWSQFPADSSDTSQWHPLNCATANGSSCTIANLAYSGASVAMTSGDVAQIAQFDFPAPTVNPALSNHFCLLAMVDSPEDPISQTSKASFFVDGITPSDNNVTHRNYQNLVTTDLFVERILVRNPFDRPLRTELRVTAPKDWEISSDPFGIGKSFDLKPLEEVPVTLTIGKAAGKGIVTLSQEDVGGEKARLIGGLSLRFRTEP